MDSKTVKLFVDLGLPEEIVREIEKHLIDICHDEHRQKFQINELTYLLKKVNLHYLRNRRILRNMDMFIQIFKEARENDMDFDEIEEYRFFLDDDYDYYHIGFIIKEEERSLRKSRKYRKNRNYIPNY